MLFIIMVCLTVGLAKSELKRRTAPIIGVWRGASKGVGDGRRPPALWAGHPPNGLMAIWGVARTHGVKR
jgi:hypothetical protein